MALENTSAVSSEVDAVIERRMGSQGQSWMER
jgi:hypothetical protein